MGLKERFISMVDNAPGGTWDVCWPWTGAVDKNGYGVIWAGEKRRALRAHRASWELFKGEIAKGAIVCHRCDNPKCVRPSHLFIGTNATNSDDMVRKGRSAKRVGSLNGLAKLTPEIVARCRVRASLGASVKGLAREFGVYHTVMQRAVSRKTWKGVP
jgi:hypothetical protein